MTTIAAIVKDGFIAMGADGQEQGGSSTITETRRRKLVELPGDGVVGVCGDSRTFNLLAALLVSKPDRIAEVTEATTCPELVEALKAAMDRDGYGRQDETGTRGYGNAFLVVVGPTLWEVASCLHHAPAREGWPVAIGSGRDVALGAMDAALRIASGLSAPEIVALGLICAAGRDCYTGGELTVATRPVGGGEWRRETIGPVLR